MATQSSHALRMLSYDTLRIHSTKPLFNFDSYNLYILATNYTTNLNVSLVKIHPFAAIAGACETTVEVLIHLLCLLGAPLLFLI